MSNFLREELTVWQKFQQGDKASFAAIYYEYFARLYEYGLRISAEDDLVKDSIHDLFLKLWTNKGNLGEVVNIRAYLIVSLRSTIYNSLEKRKKHPQREVKEEDRFELTFTVENELIKKEQLASSGKTLLASLDQLTPRQREFIYLKYFEELSYEEIAAILQISTKAAYKLSARSLESLRQIYNISSSALLILLSVSVLRY